MKGRARSEHYNDVFTRHHVDMGNFEFNNRCCDYAEFLSLSFGLSLELLTEMSILMMYRHDTMFMWVTCVLIQMLVSDYVLSLSCES